MPRRLLYAVPAVAALVAGYTLVGPGKARSVVGARVFGAPGNDGTLRSLRIVAGEREDQRERALQGELRVGSGDWGARVDRGEAGVFEVRLDEPMKVGVPLVVTLGEKELARGTLVDPSEDEREAVVVFPSPASGNHEGALVVNARLARGPLVPPFQDAVSFEIEDAQGKPVDAVSEVKLDGATCVACTAPTRSTSRFDVDVIPIADVVGIEVTSKAMDGRTGSFSGKLTTAMGSLWLARSSRGSPITILAANPKPRAYVSIFEAGERVGGAVVSLADRGDGFYAGTLDAIPGSHDSRSLILATDERETGRTATAWRLEPPVSSEPRSLRRLVRLLDGFPEATQREAKRLVWVHRILAGFIGCLAILEVILLGALARRSRKDLSQHFRETIDVLDDGEQPSPIQPAQATFLIVFVVGALVVLAAAAVIALTVVVK